MNKEDVIQYFGGRENGAVRKIAAAIDVTTQYINQWPDLVPENPAAKLHAVTDGELKYDPADYRQR